MGTVRVSGGSGLTALTAARWAGAGSEEVLGSGGHAPYVWICVHTFVRIFGKIGTMLDNSSAPAF